MGEAPIKDYLLDPRDMSRGALENEIAVLREDVAKLRAALRLVTRVSPTVMGAKDAKIVARDALDG